MHRLLSLILALFATSALAVDIPVRNPSSGGKFVYKSGMDRADDAVMAWLNGSTVLTVSTGQTFFMGFDTAPVDRNSSMTTSSSHGIYTCKKAGIYRVTLHGTFVRSSGTMSTSGEAFNVAIRKNGTQYGGIVEVDTTELSILQPWAMSTVVSLAATDTIDVLVSANFNSGHTYNGSLLNPTLTVSPL